MSVPPFSWPRLIAEIPTDVIFQVVGNGVLCEVKAHRMILGMVSPIFYTMFYSTEVGDKTAHEIKIEETTAPALQILIDAIYNYKALEDSLKDKSVREVFDVVNLVERYQITEFTEIINKLLSNYPVTEDSVLEVAGEAMLFNNLFQKEVKILLLVCAKFLQLKLKDVNSIFKYVKANEDKKEIVATLLGLLAPVCTNCGNVQCKDGEEITEDDLRVGLIVNFENVFTAKITQVFSAENEGGKKMFEVEIHGDPIMFMRTTLHGDIFFYCK